MIGFLNSIPWYIWLPFAVSGACAAVTSFFPSNHSNGFAQLLLDIGNFFGWNWMNNKNKDDARP